MKSPEPPSKSKLEPLYHSITNTVDRKMSFKSPLARARPIGNNPISTDNSYENLPYL